MFSESLKQLIEASLVDGVLTDAERNVIIKRALLEGCDPDEVNLLLDAEVQKIRLKKQANAPKVNKCPACGEILPALTGICPSCGHVVNNNDSHNQELDFLIEQINRGLAQLKGGTTQAPMVIAALEEHRRRAMTLYGENPKVRMLIDEVSQEIKTYKEEEEKRNKEEAERRREEAKVELKKAEIQANGGSLLANKGCQKGCLWAFLIFMGMGVIGMLLDNTEEKVDKEYEELVEQLDNLKSEPITVENFEQKLNDLNDVFWTNIDETPLTYEKSKKEAFEKLYQNYVDQLASYYVAHEQEVDKYYGRRFFGDDDE